MNAEIDDIIKSIEARNHGSLARRRMKMRA